VCAGGACKVSHTHAHTRTHAHTHTHTHTTHPYTPRQEGYFHYLFGVMEEGFWGAVDTRDVRP
jgi:hypothetical protein